MEAMSGEFAKVMNMTLVDAKVKGRSVVFRFKNHLGEKRLTIDTQGLDDFEVYDIG